MSKTIRNDKNSKKAWDKAGRKVDRMVDEIIRELRADMRSWDKMPCTVKGSN